MVARCVNRISMVRSTGSQFWATNLCGNGKPDMCSMNRVTNTAIVAIPVFGAAITVGRGAQ